MTAPVFRASFERALADLKTRLRILEAVPNGGTISEITSTGATVTITNPFGPVTNLEAAGGSGIQFDVDNQGGYLDITANNLDADLHGLYIVSSVGDNTHSDPPAADVVFGFPITGSGLGGDSGRIIFAIPAGVNSRVDFLRKTGSAVSSRVRFLSISKDGSLHMNENAGVTEAGGNIYNAASVQAMAWDIDPAVDPRGQSTFIGGLVAGPPTDPAGRFMALRDFVIDSNGDMWICIVSGTPGTWKRVRPYNSGTVASSGTPTINTDRTDVYEITAQAAAITSFTTNLTGTPIRGQKLHIAITDNGTARAITWGTKFEASTVALPTTTVISTRLDVDFIWNPATSKWRCLQAV